MSINRRRFLHTGALAVTTTATLAACGSSGGDSGSSTSTPAGPPREGGTLRVGALGKAAAIVRDPFGVQPNESDYLILSLVYDTLVIPGKSPITAPRIARHWEPSADLKSWRFTLADDVLFHDGTKMTAKDVLWSLQKLRNSAAGTWRMPGVPKDGISIDGKNAIVIKSEYPDNALPTLLRLTTFIQKENTKNPEGAPGTGPFKYEWYRDGNARLVRNDKFYGPKVHLDAIEVRLFDSTTALTNAALSGEIDLASNAGPVAARTAESHDDIAVIRRPDDLAIPIVMRASDGPFADPRVREALKLAVDRQAMVDQAISGYGHVANDILGTGDPLYAKDIPQRTRDLDRAKKLLAEAKFDLGKSYELLTTEELPGVAEAASVFADQVKEVGVNVNVRKQDQASFLGAARGKATLYTSYWGTNDSVVVCAGKMLVSTSTQNEGSYHDPGFDAAYRSSVRSNDEQKTKDLMHQMQQIQYDRSSCLVWGMADGIDLAKKNVQGLPTLPGYGRVQLENAWLSG